MKTKIVFKNDCKTQLVKYDDSITNYILYLGIESFSSFSELREIIKNYGLDILYYENGETDNNNFLSKLDSLKINGKKILNGYYSLLDEYEELKKLSNRKDIFIKIDDFINYISISEYYEIQKKVNKILFDISKYNFSPLEKMIYIYDLVRKNKPGENDILYKSRDLNYILKGENCVCTGYINYMKVLCDGLGIHSNHYKLFGKIDHERLITHLVDNKYDINCICFSDPTIDANYDDDWKYDYNSLLKNYHYFEEFDSAYFNNYELNYTKEFINKCFYLINNLDSFFESIDQKTYKNINYLLNFYHKTKIKLKSSKKEIKSSLEFIISLFDKLDSSISDNKYLLAIQFVYESIERDLKDIEKVKNKSFSNQNITNLK